MKLFDLFKTKTKVKETIPVFFLLMQLEEVALQQAKNTISNKNDLIIPDEKLKKEELKNITKTISDLNNASLQNTKNYKILLEKKKKLGEEIGKIEKQKRDYEQNYKKAEELILFIKWIKSNFGQSLFLINYHDFEKLCDDYCLTQSILDNFQGTIPDKNLKDILKFKKIYKEIPNSEYFKNYIGINTDKKKDINTFFGKITDIISKNSSIGFLDLKRTTFNEYVCCVRDCKYSWETPTIQLHPNWKDFNKKFNDLLSYPNCNIKVKIVDCPLKIACLREDIIENNINIIYTPDPPKPKKPKLNSIIKLIEELKDPIIYFDTPFGAVVVTAWGEESEDQIMKHFEKVNNIISSN